MKKILVVEDNELNLELACQVLEDHYELVTATNGEEALAAVRTEAPDLVLMDLSMPVMDGWEATRRLRADPATARLPIVALTAHAIKEELARAEAAGCSALLTKPLDEDQLLAKLREILGP